MLKPANITVIARAPIPVHHAAGVAARAKSQSENQKPISPK